MNTIIINNYFNGVQSFIDMIARHPAETIIAIVGIILGITIVDKLVRSAADIALVIDNYYTNPFILRHRKANNNNNNNNNNEKNKNKKSFIFDDDEDYDEDYDGWIIGSSRSIDNGSINGNDKRIGRSNNSTLLHPHELKGKDATMSNNKSSRSSSSDVLTIHAQFLLHASHMNSGINYSSDKNKEDSWWVNNSSGNNSTSSSSAISSTVKVKEGRKVHWPANLDTRKQMVVFDKKVAASVRHIGSPFEEDWFYNACDVEWENEYWENCIEEEHSNEWRRGVAWWNDHNISDDDDDDDDNDVVMEDANDPRKENELPPTKEQPNEMNSTMNDTEEMDWELLRFSSKRKALGDFELSVSSKPTKRARFDTRQCEPVLSSILAEENITVEEIHSFVSDDCNHEIVNEDTEEKRNGGEEEQATVVSVVIALGSIWVKHPKYGFVRRSSRIMSKLAKST